MSGLEAILSEQNPPPLSLTQAVQGYIACNNNQQTDFYKDCAGVGSNGSYTTAISQLLESNVSLDELINSYFILEKQIDEWYKNPRISRMFHAFVTSTAKTMQGKIQTKIINVKTQYDENQTDELQKKLDTLTLNQLRHQYLYYKDYISNHRGYAADAIRKILPLIAKMEEGKKGSASGGTKRGKFHSLKTKTYKKRTNKKLKRKRSTQKKLKK
jgi:hypothetical protein